MSRLAAPQRRIRVCHVITLLELGGAQQNTLYTVAHLDRRRFEPALAAGRGGLLDDEAKSISDLRTFFVPELIREAEPWSDFRALVRLTAIFRAARPDIVHTHSSKAGILGRWAAHLAGVPAIVHSVHGFGVTPGQSRLKRWVFGRLEAATAPVTTRFLAVSRANLADGVRRGFFPRNRVALLRSGVDLASFRNGISPGDLRARLGIAAAAPIAGMVACLKPQKAPLDYVEVASRVAARIPAAHFLLIGDGELRPGVEEAVRREQLEGRFHLLGWRRDIPSIMRNLSVLVLTSLWEGLPRVIPEAMAAGVPVVATRVDGIPEVVRDGETGYLAEPHDVDTLARRVAELLACSDLRLRMGTEARAAVGEFDIDAMVRSQEALYQELVVHSG
ncbi:MAG TPA: glycosyltransferase family 4 protein [Candidatus Polarisedimenticolia bacterium]|jgi:glycosyltransferase involved in cell wall biosynthesis|nr:glycosyltransferase family 4 protein [Candidatus Polarisedimenticolia bacterium]